jgi:gas vesicle protein
LDALGAKIDDLARNIGQRFEQVDAKIDGLARSIDKRFEQVDAKIDDLARSIDKRFEQVDKRLLSLESHFFHMQLTLVGGTLGVIAALLAAPHL